MAEQKLLGDDDHLDILPTSAIVIARGMGRAYVSFPDGPQQVIDLAAQRRSLGPFAIDGFLAIRPTDTTYWRIVRLDQVIDAADLPRAYLVPYGTTVQVNSNGIVSARWSDGAEWHVGTPTDEGPGAASGVSVSGTSIQSGVGNSFFQGQGAPTDSLGQPGDSYLDDVSGDFFLKE